MALRFSVQLLWLLAAACAGGPKPAAEHTGIQRGVAAEVTSVCARPAAERQAEIERLKTKEGIAVVCPHD